MVATFEIPDLSTCSEAGQSGIEQDSLLNDKTVCCICWLFISASVSSHSFKKCCLELGRFSNSYIL
jgi:hypothetical protein